MIIRDAERRCWITLTPDQTVEMFRRAARAAGDAYLTDDEAEQLVIVAAREVERE